MKTPLLNRWRMDGTTVRVVDGALQPALNDFARRCLRAGIPQHLKQDHFVPRPERRRVKSLRARARQRGTI
jgi:ribosomal protein S21